jgi:tetratricopeptide (TPR) repeat protein
MNVIVIAMLICFTAGLIGETHSYAYEKEVIAMELGGYSQVCAYAYAVYGDKMAKKRDYKTAMRCYSKSIHLKQGQKNLELYLCSRGFFYLDLHNYDAARADFSKAIDLNPKYACSYAGRGDALLALGDLTGAAKDYEQSVRLDPSFEKYSLTRFERLDRAKLKLRPQL